MTNRIGIQAGFPLALILLSGCFGLESEGDGFSVKQGDFYGKWVSSSRNSISIKSDFLAKTFSSINGVGDLAVDISDWVAAEPEERDFVNKEDVSVYSKGFSLYGSHAAGSYYPEGTSIAIRVFINKEKNKLYHSNTGVYEKQTLK